LSRFFFTDRDLGKRFPEILTAAGLSVERHDNLFPPDGPDEQWLEHCGKNGRVAISHNERIRYTPNELAAGENLGLGALIVHYKLLNMMSNITHEAAGNELAAWLVP
jgi:hypothetical protein